MSESAVIDDKRVASEVHGQTVQTISVCICTRNRPEELRRALTSLGRSTRAVDAVIISDDSTDDRTWTMLRTEYPEATYLRGPRLGLGANRNNALNAVRTSHVLFLDDDACLGERFVDTVFSYLIAVADGARGRTIVTGVENRNGSLVFPRDQNFLGFQDKRYGTNSILKTIVINSTVFPTVLFARVRFDEQLVYGSDEVDLAVRAVRAGFTLRLCPEAVNWHYPSPINRDYYRPYTDASRLYVTFKRYFFVERHTLRAVSYAALGPAHVLGARVKAQGVSGIPTAFRVVSRAWRYVIAYWKKGGHTETN